MATFPSCDPDIESCIVEFLLTLAQAELQALRGVVTSAVTIAQVVKQLITVQLEQLVILQTIYTTLLSPITAAQDALLASLGLLPLNRLPDCIGLGSLVNDLRALIRQLNPRVPVIEDFLNELDQKIANFNARLIELIEFIDFSDLLLDCLDQVGLFIDQTESGL